MDGELVNKMMIVVFVAWFNKTGTASVLIPQYDDWYEKNIFNEWFAFALSDRFDREDFFTCFPSKWQYWRDAYRFRD